MPAIRYDLSGRVSMNVIGDNPGTLAKVAHQMDPFEGRSVAGGSDADVLLEFVEGSTTPVDVHNPARDGLTTAFDGKTLSLMSGDRACRLAYAPDGVRLTVRCDPAFPIGPLFRTVLRPALQSAAVGHGAAAVHSAAVEMDGRAVLVAGWSESGKTETALALMEGGAGWLSDKWTLVGVDGEASAFPINVGVRRWVLPYLPRLAKALPRAAKAQVMAAGAMAGATRPLRRRSSRGGAVGIAAMAAERAVALVDRTALTPSEIRAAYGGHDDPARRIPLGTIALLTTVPGSGIDVETCDAEWAAARLALTGAYERHDWFMLQDRRRYADPAVGDDRERALAADRQVLEKALAGAKVLSVRAPFPVDPRRVARAVQDAM